MNPFTQLSNLSSLLNITQKGYTGHIQVDHAAVIHMGGRIYDPELGRFMQADPIVQDPRDAQSLNRYSYVFNNPLSYTDPTGYDCHNLVKQQCNSAIEQQKEDTAKAAQKTSGNSKSEEVSKGNQSTNSPNSAQVASGNKPDATFWKAVGAELWNNAGGYAKQIFTGAFNSLTDNAPEAFADVSGYSSAVEIADALKAGDGQALAIAVGVGVAKPLKIAERLDDVVKKTGYGPNDPPVRIQGEW